MNNIYVKQMQRLGINPKQYAELIDIPYEVVKDFIYNKEGEYKMGLKDLLRKNMIEKHQEIEENYEEAKLKAMTIKHNDNEIDYLYWYNNEYSVALLKSVLKVNSISEFKKNYDLLYNGERFSNWTYQLLLGKREYAGHEIDPNKKLEFIKQLYDILINKNSDEYLRNKPFYPNEANRAKIIKWNKKFNLKQYLEDNNMTQSDFSRKVGISTAVVSKMVNGVKTNYLTPSLMTVYNYVMGNSSPVIEKPKYNEREVIDWFNNFDFNSFRRRHGMSNEVIAENCGLSHSTVSKMSQRNYMSIPAIAKLYNYVKSLEDSKPIIELEPVEEEPKLYPSTFEEEPIEENIENDVVSDDLTSEKVDNYTPQTVSNDDSIDNNNNLLRKILVNRLTSEEKELIRIFGGNLEI